MIASNKLLREMIRLVVEEKLKPDASKDAVFGRFLFGDERTSAPVSPEKDTPDEKKLAKDLFNHYHGIRSLPKESADLIRSLIEMGEYQKILALPIGTAQVYRGMVLTPKKFSLLFGFAPKQKGKLNGSWTYSPKGGKAVSSWSTQMMGAYDFSFEEEHSAGAKGSIGVMMTAVVSKNNNKFILNPNYASEFTFSKGYAYQKETIGIGSINVSEISWHSSDVFDDDDKKL